MGRRSNKPEPPSVSPPYDALPSPPEVRQSALEVEEAVLGSIIIDGECIERVMGFLLPEDFGREKHKLVYQAAIGLHYQKSPIDQVTITQKLQADGSLGACGGPAFISSLVLSTATSAHVEAYGHIVHNARTLRDLKKAGVEIAEIAESGNPESMDGLIDKAAEVLQRVQALSEGLPSAKIDVQQVKILKTAPPHYLLKVNGKDMKVSLETLLTPMRFKKQVVAELDFVPSLPAGWDRFVNMLLGRADKLEAPADASREMQLRQAVGRFFEHYPEYDDFEDLKRGGYHEKEIRGMPYRFFYATPMVKWVKQDINLMISIDDLWTNLHTWGGIKHGIRIKDASRQLWGIPTDFASEERQERLPEWF